MSVTMRRNAGSGRPFRTSDPLLESRRWRRSSSATQQDPHHQPREDPGACTRRRSSSCASSPRTRAPSCSSAPSARRAKSSRKKRSAAGMPFVDYRWLGGMLTNFKTVKQSIKRLKDMEADGAGRHARAAGEERSARLSARDAQAERSLGGIKDMNGAARRAVHHRRRLPEGRGRRSEQARHPGDRRGRHEPLARRHRLRHPGQRRLEPRDPPVCARHGRRGARRPHQSLEEIVDRPSDEFVEVEEPDGRRDDGRPCRKGARAPFCSR